jgi:hypothetical protein
LDPSAIKDEILQPCIIGLINRLDEAHPTINSPREIELTKDQLYQGIDDILRTHGKMRKEYARGDQTGGTRNWTDSGKYI